MRKKKIASMDEYFELGAVLKLLYDVAVNACVKVGNYVPRSERKFPEGMLGKISELKSDLEDLMYRTHVAEIKKDPKNKYTRVFYGSLDRQPQNEIEEKVVLEATKIMKSIFGNNYPGVEWFRCEETLPDSDREVLIYALRTGFGYMQVAMYDEGRNGWFVPLFGLNDKFEEKVPDPVTLWAELPKPTIK